MSRCIGVIFQLSNVIRNSPEVFEIFVVFVDLNRFSSRCYAPDPESGGGQQLPELAKECLRVDISTAELKEQRADAPFREGFLGALQRE